mgnify:FL=1
MKSKQIFQSRSPQRDAFGTGIRREMTSQLYQAVNELPDIYNPEFISPKESYGRDLMERLLLT